MGAVVFVYPGARQICGCREQIYVSLLAAKSRSTMCLQEHHDACKVQNLVDQCLQEAADGASNILPIRAEPCGCDRALEGEVV